MYSWKGMTIIKLEEGFERFFQNKDVYMLYDDETECLALTLNQIKEHEKSDGKFGYENGFDTSKYDVSCCSCGRVISVQPDEQVKISNLKDWRCSHC